MVTASIFEATDRQRVIWDLLAEAEEESLTIIGYGGAIGGGKTRALAELAIDLSLAFPGNRILVGRKDLVDLRTTTLEEFDTVCDRALIVKSVNSPIIERHIRLPEWPVGVVSRVFFRELKDYQSLGSEQYGAALLEEAGEIPEQAYKMLITRMRHPGARKRTIICASNPYPGWFERWFIDKEYDAELLRDAGATVHFVPAKIRDNPHLPPNYEAIMRGVFASDEDWYNRMVEGSFASFEGQIYRDLGPHMEWTSALPDFSRLVGGLDFGGAKETSHKSAGVLAGIVARDQPGIAQNALVRFAHFEDSGPNVGTRQLEWMRGWEAKMKRRVEWRADKTQMWGIEQAQNMGFVIEPSHGGADSITAGIGLVKRRMSDGASFFTPDLRQRPALDGKPLSGSSWYDRMRRYRWDEQVDETKAARGVPLKRDDDTADADRYMHEAADGFPINTGPVIHKRTLSGKRRRRKAA